MTPRGLFSNVNSNACVFSKASKFCIDIPWTWQPLLASVFPCYFRVTTLCPGKMKTLLEQQSTVEPCCPWFYFWVIVASFRCKHFLRFCSGFSLSEAKLTGLVCFCVVTLGCTLTLCLWIRATLISPQFLHCWQKQPPPF